MLAGLSYVRPLGSGGFADVFLYEQDMPRRGVAVKVLPNDVHDAELLRMFNAEADVLARLSAHPSIVTVYQAGISADGRPFIVMEFCPSSLARRYRLDGLMVGTVTELRTYTPQRLSLQLELVSAETGQAIWNATLALDSGSERVKRSIDVWCNNHRASTLAPESSDLVLLSPARFANFAAYEVARVL